MAGFNAEQLNIIISARTQDLQKELDKSQRRIKGFERSAGKSLSNTSRSFSALGSAARRLAPALLAAFSVRSFSRMVEATAEVGRMANLAGTGVVEFQKFAAGARTVGIDIGKTADIIKDMNDRVGDFISTGGGPMADFFENIAPMVGVTADHFARLSGPEALQLYVSSLEKANLSQAELTFYMEAIASDSTALLPLLRNNGSEMNRLGDEAERTGRILSEDAVDGAKELEEKARDLSESIKTQLTAAILDNKDELMLLVSFITETAIPAFSGLIGAIAKGAEYYKLFTDPDFVLPSETPAQLDPSVREGDVAAANALGGSDPSGTGLFYVDENGNVQSYGADTPSIPGITAPAKPPSTTGTGTGTGTSGGGSGGGNDWADEIARLRDEYAGLLKSMDPVVAAELEFAENAELVNRALEAGVITTDQQAQVMGKLREQMNEAKIAASEFAGVADTLKSGLENAFMSILDGTESAKDAFRSMATDVIRELYRVLVVQELVGSFNTGGGGILGMLAPMFGRASGGSVMAGRPYMVGEHGREPFIPAQNGRILSTAQAKDALSGGGGGTVIVNQTINVTTGVQQTVRAEIQSMLPRIVETTKAAVFDAQRRSVNGLGYA